MNRIWELDVCRGIAIFIMIVVDAPPIKTYDILIHASWEGLTIADLAFPGFIFAMGMSAAVSSSRRVASWRKIFVRAGLLFLLGIFLNEIGYFLAYLLRDGFTSTDLYNYVVEHLRFFGILQRLALTYMFAMAITKFIRSDKKILATAFGLLIVYSLGFHIYSPENPFNEMHNISSTIDFIFPGVNHILEPTHDPEGLYGTIATTASMLFGFLAGRILISEISLRDKILRLVIFGVILLSLGVAWSYFDIIAKKIWTAPFALLTSSINLLLLSILVLMSNSTSSVKKFFQPLAALGKNPLFFFVASILLLIFVYVLDVWTKIFEYMLNFLPSSNLEFSCMIFCLLLATFWTIIAVILDKLGVVIKI